MTTQLGSERGAGSSGTLRRGISFLLFGMLFFLAASFQSITPASAATNSWAKSGDDFGANSVAQTSDGGYALVRGLPEGMLWVAKTDGNGVIEWQKQYEFGETFGKHTIWSTDDGGYVVVGRISVDETQEDAWVLKLDSDGNVEWEKAYGQPSENDLVNSVQQTDDGGYIVAGETFTDERRTDAWVLKLDTNGNVEWEKAYGAIDDEFANAVQQTIDGGYVVAGQIHLADPWFSGFAWVLKLDADGEVEWQKAYSDIPEDSFPEDQFATSIQQTSDGGYVFAGQTAHGFRSIPNGWIVKLDGNGNMEWERAFGARLGGDGEALDSVQVTEDGGYVAAGSGVVDIIGSERYSLLVKLDSDGNAEWQRIFGGLWSGVESGASSIIQASDGGYVAAGRHLLKLDVDGLIDDCLPFREVDYLIQRELDVISTTVTTDAQIFTTNSTITETEAIVSDADIILGDQCPVADSMWVDARDEEQGLGDDGIPSGGDITIRAFTDLADVKQVRFDVLNFGGNIVRTTVSDTATPPTNPAITPDDCGDDPEDDECLEYLVIFSGMDPEDDKGSSFKVRATFLDVNGNAIGSAEDSVRFDSFFVLPESPIGILALIGSSLAVLGGFMYLRSRTSSGAQVSNS